MSGAEPENSENNGQGSSTFNSSSKPEPLPLILDGKFFKIIRIENKIAVTAQCCKCSKLIKGQLNATTNFRNHLKARDHSLEDFEEYKRSRFVHPTKRKVDVHATATNTNKKLRQTTLSNHCGSNEQQAADSLISNFIVQTLSPLSIVENAAFVNMIHGINKLKGAVNVITRKTLSKKIDNDYNHIVGGIKAKLENVRFVCTTADVWSSSKRSYMGVTAHWINNEFVRESSALACRRFKGAHTYDKVATIIGDVHDEFINRSFTTIVKTVTDNGANMVKAFEESHKSKKYIESRTQIFDGCSLQQLMQDDLLKDVIEIDYESDENEEQDETFLVPISNVIQPAEAEDDIHSVTSDVYLPPHQRCVSHTLNLITTTDIKKAFSKNPNTAYSRLNHSTFGKCSAIWNITSKSPKACEIYQTIANKSPTSPCPTRWNSTFDSLLNILKVRDKLNDICQSLNLPKFKESEFEFLTEYVEVLRPFAESLDKLQGSQSTFYGELIPQLLRIQKIVKSLQLRQLKYCSILVTVLSESLESRFKDYLTLSSSVNDAILATITHPFFKLRWAPSEKKTQLKDLLLNELKVISTPTHENEDQVRNTNPDINVLDDKYFLFDDTSTDNPQSTNLHNALQLEALQYLQSPLTNLTMLDQFPNIKKLFIKFNTSLPSSAPVERLFSYAGMIMRPKRRCMGDDTFEKLLIIKANVNLFTNK